MMIAEYMHFYSASLAEVLSMYAVSFYALYMCIFRVQAKKDIDELQLHSSIHGNNISDYFKSLQQQQKGIQSILEEIKIIRQARK